MGGEDKIRKAWRAHKNVAKQRGIPFLLTYEEWRKIWMESGKWKQRGNRRGQYVMMRPGDKGAYELGNVIIARVEDNRADRNRNYTITGERHHFYGVNPWSFYSDPEAAKAKLSKSQVIATRQRVRGARGRFVAKDA